MSKLDNLRNELNAAREKLNAKGLHFDGNINDYDELMKIKPFEIAYQDAIERVWPDSAWWQVTGYWDIFDAMMSGIDDKAIIDEICNHVGKDYLIESANDVVNGACVEFNHNIKEYMSKFGDAYDNGDLWDFSKEDFENGAIDPRDDITYWYMRDLNGDWRYFETNIKCEKEEKKLDEGASNFGRGPEHFPLLVFYTYDEFDYNVKHDPDYPQEDQFEDEDGNIDYDALEQAQYDFEEKAWEDEKVCVLDEDSVERLKDKLYDFNEESKRMAWDADVVDGEQQYGYNLNLEDVMLEIEPGYYEAAYINVEHEDYLDDLEDDFREQQIERFTKFFQELKEEFGLTPLGVAWGPASNGETGYKILNDDLEEEKKDKKVKVRFCGDPAKEAEFFNHTMGSDDASETPSVSLGEDSSKPNLKPEARNHYKKHCCKENTIKESFEEIYIKYWEDEDLRDQGISEIYTDNFATREEAIETARKLVDRDGFASVEVFVSPSGTLESEDDKLIWGYDGVDTWGLGKDKDESLDEGSKPLDEGRYADISKRLAIAEKELKELKAKYDAETNEDEKDWIGDDIMWKEIEIGDLKGALAEIRYLDNGSASNYDGYESLDESRGKGFVCKYKGYNIIDAGDRYVITNKNGLNVGESKFGIPVVKGIIDEFDNVEDKSKDEKLKESEEDNGPYQVQFVDEDDEIYDGGTFASFEDAKEAAKNGYYSEYVGFVIYDNEGDIIFDESDLDESLKENLSQDDLRTQLEDLLKNKSGIWQRKIIKLIDEEGYKECLAACDKIEDENLKKSVRDALTTLVTDSKEFKGYKESLKESNEVARVEYCVMDKDNNNIECFNNTDDAIAFAKENDGIRVLEVQYGPKDEHGDEPELGTEEVWSIRESLDESEDDVYSLHVKVLDTHSGRPIKVDRIMVGSRKECMDKKKQLEETSPEDSYHNRNVYTVSKVK